MTSNKLRSFKDDINAMHSLQACFFRSAEDELPNIPIVEI